MYKLQEYGVKRISDGACIPEAPGNTDWQDYQSWLSKGNIPEPEFTQKELRDKVKQESNDLLLDQLIKIDLKSIRPLREGNTTLITQYEEEAEALRVKLKL